MGVADALEMFVDPDVPSCREPGVLNRLEEVDCIVPTAEEPASMPSTGTGSSQLILDYPPVILRSNSGFDIWVERMASACLSAPIVAPPKIFEVPASLKGFDVPLMVLETDVND